MNEAEYLMNNYGDRGGCYPSRPQAPSQISIILHMIRKPNSIIVLLFSQNNSQFKNMTKTCLPYLHRSIDVKFIFDSTRLGLSSSANILQIEDVALRVVFLLFLPCFQLFFAQFLLLKRVKCPPFFKFTSKTTQPRPQVLSVNGALTCTNAAFLTSFPR